MVLIHTPSVYNHTCQWPTLPSSAVPSSSSSSGVNSSIAATSNLEWPTGTSHLFSAYDLFRCIVVLTITFGLIAGNILLAMATNCKFSASVLQFQTRCLLTSIATNHAATGFLVTAWNIYPSFIGCWPYGVLLCQIQAVLLGSLSQHNSILWILVAIDRYIFATRRGFYRQLAPSKHCVWIVALTWSLSFAYYTSIVLPYSAFDFSKEGLGGCEPTPVTGVLMLVSTCLLYFPTTMTLLYVYGTVFHSSRSSSSSSSSRHQQRPTTTTQHYCNNSGQHDEENPESDQYCNLKVEESVTRAVATMSLAFVINCTPWIIKQIIVSCLNNEVAPWLDFLITWSSLSLGVWNPFLCWLLCPPIREGVRHVLANVCCICCYSNNYLQPTTRRSSTLMTQVSSGNGLAVIGHLPPLPCEMHPTTHSMRSPAPVALHMHHHHQQQQHQQQQQKPLMEQQQGELIWGEILERSLSSGSLHHLQRLQCNHDNDPASNKRHQKPNNGFGPPGN